MEELPTVAPTVIKEVEEVASTVGAELIKEPVMEPLGLLEQLQSMYQFWAWFYVIFALLVVLFLFAIWRNTRK